MDFRPDSPCIAKVVPSGNFGARADGTRPDLIVLHYTGMPSADDALRRLCDPAAQVSAHYLVFEDGRVVQMVPERMRAWHAGVSCWRGERDINSRSIGIEIANPGHEFGYPDFPERQIEATLGLCRDIAARHGIGRHGLVAHSDVAPARKQDPGEKFPWARFAAAGLGLWVKPAPLSCAGSELAPGRSGRDVAALRNALTQLGYEAGTGVDYDEPLTMAVAAFQRHFRPARIDGVADASTRDTLRRLLDQAAASENVAATPHRLGKTRPR